MDRIRGWFPEAPKSLKLSITPTFEANTPSSQGNYKNAVKMVSKKSVGSLLFWNIICLFLFTFIFENLSIVAFTIMAIVGVLIGAFLGAFPAAIVLKALSQGRKTCANLSEIITIAFLPLIAAVLYGFLIGQYIFMVYRLSELTEFNFMLCTFGLSSILAIVDARIILFLAWERRNNYKILRGKGLTLLIVPKSSGATNFSQNIQKMES
jgi:hypothetical protein